MCVFVVLSHPARRDTCSIYLYYLRRYLQCLFQVCLLVCVKFLPSLGPGRPSQNLSSIFRLFVSRTQQQSRKLLFFRLFFYLDEFHKSRFVISFHIYTLSTRTEITFRMYIYTQAIPKGRVPVFYIPNSFWATKGHGRRRRSFWFSHEMSGPRFCGSGAHGKLE